MLTIKSLGQGDKDSESFINMSIFQADLVEERIHPQTGNRCIRLVRYPTSAAIATMNETTLLLDTNRVYGPALVFVENESGRTVQRFSADRAVEPPKQESS